MTVVGSNQSGQRAVGPSISDAMLSKVPTLRAFAIALCKDTDRADDLVQETLMRAWAHIDSFEPGTNMEAWLFTILRNAFHSECRKRRREVADTDGFFSATLKSEPQQAIQRQFEEFRAALAQLPVEQREALLLIGASGFSYEEAAKICQCAVGTIKSRVNRARQRLAQLLQIDSLDDFRPEAQQRAVFTREATSIQRRATRHLNVGV